MSDPTIQEVSNFNRLFSGSPFLENLAQIATDAGKMLLPHDLSEFVDESSLRMLYRIKDSTEAEQTNELQRIFSFYGPHEPLAMYREWAWWIDIATSNSSSSREFTFERREGSGDQSSFFMIHAEGTTSKAVEIFNCVDVRGIAQFRSGNDDRAFVVESASCPDGDPYTTNTDDAAGVAKEIEWYQAELERLTTESNELQISMREVNEEYAAKKKYFIEMILTGAAFPPEMSQEDRKLAERAVREDLLGLCGHRYGGGRCVQLGEAYGGIMHKIDYVRNKLTVLQGRPSE